MTGSPDVNHVGNLLKSSLTSSQQVVRNRFREYARAVALDKQALAESLHRNLEMLCAAWVLVYPEIPMPAALPAALSWNVASHRRYARAQDLTERAQNLLNHGFFRDAEQDLRLALKEYKRLGAVFATAYIYMNLGVRQYEAGELIKAESFLQQANSIYLRYRHEAGLRDILMNRSMIEEARGRYPQARDMLLEAQRMNAAFCDNKTEARIVSSLGVVASEAGRLSEAEKYYRKALELRVRIGDKEGEATDTSNLGVLLDKRGLYRRGYEYFQHSLALRRASGDKEGEADSLLGMAEALAGMGRTTLATEHFFKAISIYQEMGSLQRMIDCWNQFGEFHLSLGDFSKAEHFIRGGLALANRRQFLASVADLKVDLARAIASRSDFAQADSLLREALKLQEGMGNAAAACQVRLELGILGMKVGDIFLAASNLLNAYQCAMDLGLADTFIRSSHELGQHALRTGRPEAARYYFDAAGRMASERQLAHHEWKARQGLSRAYELEGRLEVSRYYLRQALGSVLKMEREISLATHARRFWDDDKAELFRTMSRLALAQEDFTSAWAWVDLMKARLVKRRILMEENGFSSSSSPPHNEVDAESVHEEIRGLYLRLLHTPKEEAAGMAELRQRIESLEASLPSSALKGWFDSEFPDLRSAQARLRQVQQGLTSYEALIDFLSLADSLHAWVITQHGIRHLEIAIPAEEMQDLIVAAGLSADVEEDSRGQTIGLFHPMALGSLTERIWNPLAAVIPRHVRAVILVPDGNLHLLPFEILPVSSGNTNNNAGPHYRYLLHDFTVSYLSAATLMERTPLRLHRDRLNAVAFGSKPIRENESESGTPIFMPGRQAGSTGPGWPQRNQQNRVGGELDLFSVLFPASHIFHEASSPVRDGFLRSAAEGDILHIASHYQYDPASPELARFALTLSPSATNASEPLYAFEVASLHLKSALTVLSACSTGRGEIQPGEGLISMGRAFLLAGSRSVITSMWPVEEESTTAVWRHFYQYLAAGFDSREALRQAKLRMLEVPRWQHPFYWGAFILSGSPMRLIQGKELSAGSEGHGIQQWFFQTATEAAAIMGSPGLK